MNRPPMKFVMFSKAASCLGLAALLLCPSSHSQTIPNPSFEAETFSVAPGYIEDNAAITGWTADAAFGAGLSPAGGDNTFANNGTVPDGQNVAFIAGGTTFSTTITGLTAGEVYKVTARVNAPTNQTPILRITVDFADVSAISIYPVGTTAPYEYIAFEFPAASETAALGLVNDATYEQTLLVDNLTIAASSGNWTVDAWTDDATSGVDNQFVYTHAYSLGTTANAIINGVPFTGVGGINPAVADQFSITHFGSVYNADVNNITGGSAALARDFLYSGANVDSGTYQTINITGLTAGADYVATIYSAGWESPTTASRWATLSVGEDRLTINQDQFDNDNGIRFSYRYTADASGTAVLNIAPVNPVNVSIHVYGFSNREAVSRNVLPTITVQPASTTVAGGVPVDFTVGATGFPVPELQWRLNGVNLAGATTDTYSIAQADAGDVGNYDVVVGNSVGSVTSVVARLVVGLPLANSSFEEDVFLSWPGYSGDNPGNANSPAGFNIPITGWTQNAPERSGLNPVSNGESPFADNGTIPNGNQVAFLQAIDINNTLSQTVSGLTAGAQYYLHYYENSRAATPNPVVEVTLGTDLVVPAHPASSGSYRAVYGDVITAASASLDLTFSASSPGGADTTALIDNVTIVPVAAGTAPFVTRNPGDIISTLGETVTFSGQVIGSLPLSYQWLKDGSPITGATSSTLTLTGLETSAAGDYSLQVTNATGSVTTTVAHLTVNQPVPGLYNTGVDDSRAALADGETDPHYELTVNPHVESTLSIVQDSTVFPIVAGPWLANTETSKWIGPEFDTAAGAIGLYTYRTTIDLTGRDPDSVKIIGGWATDNAGRDILVNGVSTGNPENPGFNAYTEFAIYGTNTTFAAGTNTIDFIVENVDAIGYTGLRVVIFESNSLPAGSGTEVTLQVTRDGNSLSISWTGSAEGQKLQSAPDVQGPWTDVAGAANPYSTTAAASRAFFRVVQ